MILALALAAMANPVLAITHIAVIDCDSAALKSDETILIEGKSIVKIGRNLPIPAGAKTIDGKGKFAIPGLWDMHVHWYDPKTLSLFTANGVTGIRIMFGAPMHLQWREQVEKGELVGPHLYVGSPIIDGPKPVWPGSVAVSNYEEGKHAAANLKQQGYDFLKVYSLLSPDAYRGIADGAKAAKISFAGHIPDSVSVLDAARMGQKSGEHNTGLLTASSTEEKRLRDLAIENAPKGLTEYRAALKKAGIDEVATFDSHKAKSVIAAIKKSGMYWCPTLVVLRNIANLDKPDFQSDPRLKYMPSYIVNSWNPANDFRFKSRTAEDWAKAKRSWAKSSEFVGMMNKEGIPLLAGTDCLNPYCFPGFSLHDELALLVDAGLTPIQALQAATKTAGQFMGRKVGLLKPGYGADVVLLDANPLSDISNTKRIFAVIQSGRIFDRAALDKMLQDAQTAAGGRPK